MKKKLRKKSEKRKNKIAKVKNNNKALGYSDHIVMKVQKNEKSNSSLGERLMCEKKKEL